MINVDVRDHCPKLHELKSQNKPFPEDYSKEYVCFYEISLDPKTSSSENARCPVGGKKWSLEIVDDRMIHKTGRVRVSCPGCKIQDEWDSILKGQDLR